MGISERINYQLVDGASIGFVNNCLNGSEAAD
jgi:hypothetical protein